MARKFHLRNGAIELQVNETSQNFEYTIESEWWKNYLEKARNHLSTGMTASPGSSKPEIIRLCRDLGITAV